MPPSAERRLVMFLGGRSTELALGPGRQARKVASYPWAVRCGVQHHDGVYIQRAFAQAYEAARQVLQPAAQQFVRGSWDQVYASASMASACGSCRPMASRPHRAPRRANWLQEQVLRCGDVHHLQLPGLPPTGCQWSLGPVRAAGRVRRWVADHAARTRGFNAWGVVAAA